AGHDADRFRTHFYAARTRNVGGDGLPKLRKTLGGPIFGPALIQRALPRLDDMRGRREIGLTDFQVDDVASLFFERPSLDENFECRLDPDTGHSLGKLHAVTSTP